ncbi:Z1 domain-containing protein [Candidatus Pacearchaeota archaeon]|nr:Z1 domain-containing protein [Candidatus Pacearchaeota archaeon]
MNETETLGLVRHFIDIGISLDEAVNNPAIPLNFKDKILQTIKEEENIILEPANIIKDSENYEDWLIKEDRSDWYYWNTLRRYLLDKKGWSGPSVQSLDKETDRILGMLDSPKKEIFDKKGLVLGFVQSGKTSNYTALIAKAADSSYRLIIVLSGTDNGLRLQTHRRLKNELVGSNEGKGVPLPPIGKQWHEFTRVDLNGDFQAGFVNTAALQGNQPVLMVIKKNGAVLRRLISWLNSASEEIKRTLPLLVIDDEADLASIDTKGSYQAEDELLPEDYEAPSVINGLIRDLLNKFNRKAYIAYTATPFANILIPHDNYNPRFSDDLYPKNFIVNLPKPNEYFGAEELFGPMDYVSEDENEGLDVIRTVNDSNDFLLEQYSIMHPDMEKAILSFVLAGASRSYRSKKDFPATMLIHITLRTIKQEQLKEIVDRKFTEFKDEWRYNRKEKIYDQLRRIWGEDFLPVIQAKYPNKLINFKDIETNISTFFESVQIRSLNSVSGDSQALDYEKEPNLKLIAIGGNKLSRGLTLEGLLISFFTRRTKQYDTLMQMGRWFGFRGGYEDLTRIYTTPELSGWFSSLSQIEAELREDIKIYEELKLTPFEVGLRIKAHPVMQVTSPSKRRFANEVLISKTYRGLLSQTIKFPLNNLEVLSKREEENIAIVKKFLSELGELTGFHNERPFWKNVPAQKVIDFLNKFQTDESNLSFRPQLIIEYIKKLNEENELIKWTVAICGNKSYDSDLGDVDLGLKIKINQINISQEEKNRNSLKGIVSQGDELIGLSSEKEDEVNNLIASTKIQKNNAARLIRDPSEGLILLYPISKNSKPHSKNRIPLYEDPKDPLAKNLIGIAISFPEKSKIPQSDELYVIGTVPWRPEDES